MSRNNNNNKKPYCKVCHDAGKSESDYTSHWVKSTPDRTGKTVVICPTLLSTECSYCHKLGHTSKFCPTIENNNRKREKEQRKIAFDDTPTKKSSNAPSNPKSKFAVLSLDSSDSEDEKAEVKEEFPTLATITDVSAPVMTGWAAIVAKPKVEKQTVFGCLVSKPKLERQTTIKLNKQFKEPLVNQVAPWAKKDTVVKKTWADYSDTESEEDEEWKRYEAEDETW